METTGTQGKERRRENEQKWGKELLAAGWTAIPSVLLERQRALGLDALDVNILFHLIRHWWYRDNLPHPSKRTIAECMAIDPSTVRRRIRAMEEAGLIRRVGRKNREHGQQSNYYDLSGLIKEMKPYAREAIATRKERRGQDAAKRMRKRPMLGVVS